MRRAADGAGGELLDRGRRRRPWRYRSRAFTRSVRSPASRSMTFSGLRSRWTTPAAWAARAPGAPGRRRGRRAVERQGRAAGLHLRVEGDAAEHLHHVDSPRCRRSRSRRRCWWRSRASTTASVAEARPHLRPRRPLASRNFTATGLAELEVLGAVDAPHAARAESDSIWYDRRPPRRCGCRGLHDRRSRAAGSGEGAATGARFPAAEGASKVLARRPGVTGSRGAWGPGAGQVTVTSKISTSSRLPRRGARRGG